MEGILGIAFKGVVVMPSEPKTRILQIRMSEKDYTGIQEKMNELGLNTPRTRSRYLRYLLTAEEVLPIPSDRMFQGLMEAFADTVRIGGLLNQIAHHINREYIQIVNQDVDRIEVDVAKLYGVLKELEAAQQEVKRHIIGLNRGRAT